MGSTETRPGPADGIPQSATTESVRLSLDAVDAVIDDFLSERIARSSASYPPYHRLWLRIRDANRGGKRLRPRLVLLAHDSLDGGAPEDALLAAASFELLHTALLLHDDVLDGDLIRRGRANLQGGFVGDGLDDGLSAADSATWGDTAGILAGDVLLSAVHLLIARMTSPARTAVHELVDDCLFVTASGEMADVGYAIGAVPAEEGDIASMMQDKTAAYSFASPLRAGALLAGADPEQQSELERIGTMLGFAYQLSDDIRGVFGPETSLGRAPDGDLREGKRTMLVAFAEGTPEWGGVRHLFGRSSIDAHDAQRLRDALTACGARERARLLLVRRCAEASERIRDARLPEPLKAELDRLALALAGSGA